MWQHIGMIAAIDMNCDEIAGISSDNLDKAAMLRLFLDQRHRLYRAKSQLLDS